MTIALGVGCTQENLSSEGVKLTSEQSQVLSESARDSKSGSSEKSDNSSETASETTTDSQNTTESISESTAVTGTQEKPQSTSKSEESSQIPTTTQKPRSTTITKETTTKPSVTAKPSTTTKVTTTTKPTTIKTTTTIKSTTTKSTTTASSSTESKFEAEVLRLVNIERTSRGLKPLSNNAKLANAADIRAVEIVQSFSHTRPNGQSPFTAIEGNWGGFSTVGENIAAGYFTPAEVVDGWMNSEGHRANILNASFTHMGVGYYYVNSGYRHNWVQMFGG